MSMGLINLGDSVADRERTALSARIALTALHGPAKVGVLGKGGAGKTTIAASTGSLLAYLRRQDRVVAIDADTSFGKLGSRVDPTARGSFWDLAGADHAPSFADVRAHLGVNAAGLFVLPGEHGIARRRVLDPGVYREAAHRLDRFFGVSVVDCGSTTDSTVAQEVLRDLDALVVVTSPWADAATSALQTLEWLATHGHTWLLQRTVVVVNDSDGHADTRTLSELVRQLAAHGPPVVTVPFEPHFRPGGVIDVARETTSPTRLGLLRLAALLVDRFATAPAARPSRHR